MIYSYNCFIEFQNSLRVDMWHDSDYVRDLLGGHYRHKIHSFNLRTTPTQSELYFEANYLKYNGTCPIWYWLEDNEITIQNDITDGIRKNLESNETTLKLQNKSNSTIDEHTPNLSGIMGLNLGDWRPSDYGSCRKYKIFEAKIENNTLVTRFYKDILNYFYDPYFDRQYSIRYDFYGEPVPKKVRIMDKLFEEKVEFGNNYYQVEQTLANGFIGYNIRTKMTNLTDKSILNVNVFEFLKLVNNTPKYKEIGNVEMEMDEANPDQIYVRLEEKAHGQKIFDGNIFSSSVFQGTKYFSQQMIPNFIKQKMLVRSNSQLLGRLSSGIAYAFKIIARNQGDIDHILFY